MFGSHAVQIFRTVDYNIGPVWEHSKICRTVLVILFGQFGNTEICRTEQCCACLETNFDQSFDGCGDSGRKESIAIHTKPFSLRIAHSERSM